MDSIDWKGLKRLSINAYQAAKVKYDQTQATTVFTEQTTSNEPWGPATRDMARLADLSYNSSEANKVLEVPHRGGEGRKRRCCRRT